MYTRLIHTWDIWITVRRRDEGEECRVEDDRGEDGKQRMGEGGKGRRAGSGSRRVAAGWFGAGGGSHSCSSASGRHFVLRERERVCVDSFMSAQEPFATESFLPSSGVKCELPRAPARGMTAARPSSCSQWEEAVRPGLLLWEGHSEPEPLHLHLSTAEPQVNAPDPFRWFRVGEHSSPVSGWDVLRTWWKVIGVVQPSLSVSICVSSVRARRRIRGSDGSRAKGQNGPFKRTQLVQGACLEMQVCSWNQSPEIRVVQACSSADQSKQYCPLRVNLIHLLSA